MDFILHCLHLNPCPACLAEAPIADQIARKLIKKHGQPGSGQSHLQRIAHDPGQTRPDDCDADKHQQRNKLNVARSAQQPTMMTCTI